MAGHARHRGAARGAGWRRGWTGLAAALAAGLLGAACAGEDLGGRGDAPADPCQGPVPPASCPTCIGPCTERVCALLTCFEITCADCCYRPDGTFDCH